MPTQARALPGIMKASTQQGSVVVPGQVGGEKMSLMLGATSTLLRYKTMASF